MLLSIFCRPGNSIFQLADRGEDIEQIRSALASSKTWRSSSSAEANDIWAMLTLASRLEETVQQAAAANEPAILAKYTFNLAKAFNLFYHNHKILPEPDETKRAVLLTVAERARDTLTAALATMGIEVPEKM